MLTGTGHGSKSLILELAHNYFHLQSIRDTKGRFHAKTGSIKDRNGMDLQKQKILRRGGKNTQKNCTKKSFMTQIITMV